MKVQCPNCHTCYKINEQKIPKTLGERFKVKCPACSQYFKVEKEVLPEPSVSSPLRLSASHDVPSEGGKRVLIVDDSRFFREMIADILKPLRLNISMASDGREALEVIGRVKPDLVLLDLNLPFKNGFEVIRSVRSDPSLEDTCLVAMSGVFHKEVDVAGIKKDGANDFIKKSFTPEVLRDRIKMWLIW